MHAVNNGSDSTVTRPQNKSATCLTAGFLNIYMVNASYTANMLFLLRFLVLFLVHIS